MDLNTKTIERIVLILCACFVLIMIIDRGYSIYTNVRINQNIDRSNEILNEQEKQLDILEEMLTDADLK